MEKVCRDWAKQAFGEGLVKAEYWNDFQTNAKTAAAEVFRVKNFAEGEAKLQELLKEYADRTGGYTRILKLGPRRGDGSEMAILQLV